MCEKLLEGRLTRQQKKTDRWNTKTEDRPSMHKKLLEEQLKR